MTERAAATTVLEASGGKRNWWPKDRVLRAVKESGGHSVKAGMTVTTVARRMFGSWAKACEAAGATPASKQKIRYLQCTVEGCPGKPRSGFSPYCEMHYGRIRRHGNVLTVLVDLQRYDACVYCERPSGGHKFCSVRCRSRHDRRVPRLKQCVMCGAFFEPLNDGIDLKTCSKACAEGKIRYHNAIRRGALRVERFTQVSIFERDNWICGICGDPVPKGAKFPHPMSASLDHVIPISKGGAHTRVNTQCSHLRCNMSKGTRTPTAQDHRRVGE